MGMVRINTMSQLLVEKLSEAKTEDISTKE